MGDPENFNQQYFSSVSSAGKELFSDFLSELSRKRQGLLLVSATVTILISFTIITPLESEFAGIKFTFTNNDALPILSSVLCLYFLIIYILSVLKDWQYYTYRNFPSHFQLNMVRDEIAKQTLEGIEEMKRLNAEFDERIKGRQRFAELSNKMSSDHEKALRDLQESTDNLIEIHKLQKKQSDEFWTLQNAVTQAAKEDGVDELVRRMTSNTLDNSLSVKAEILVDTMKKYRRLQRGNLIIEVIFPCCLGFVAIGLAIRATI